MYHKIMLLPLIIIGIACISVRADVPVKIYYQGTLTDPTGHPLTVTQSVHFSIWDQPVNGNRLWEEKHSMVAVEQGLFQVLLGSQNALPITLFKRPDIYLEIMINTEILTPRQNIASVPYALVAETIAGNSFKIGDAAFVEGHLSGNAIFASDGINTDILPARDDAGSVRILDGNGSGGLTFANWGDSRIDSYENLSTNQPSAIVLQKNGGNVGIGIEVPSEKLQVNGRIYAVQGGFKFPDGTIQTTAATGGGTGSDNLGNHTATQNVNLNTHWLSGDGNNEGIQVNNDGKVGINTNTPHTELEVNGRLLVNGPGGLNQHDRSKISFYAENLGHSIGTEGFHNVYGPHPSYPHAIGHRFYVQGNELAAQIGFGGFGTPRERFYTYFNGNVGIGIPSPAEKLQVAGIIHTTQGGFKFPDGSVQTTAATTGGSSSGCISIDFLAFKTSDDEHFFAAVNLPDGAQIMSLTYYYYDENGMTESFAALIRKKMTAAIEEVIADTELHEAVIGYGSFSDVSITNPRVDNSQFTYYLSVLIDLFRSSKFTLKGVVIQYKFI